jgi:hypothetical protein
MKNERPVFLYSMTPAGKTVVKNFFEPGELAKLLENPGQIRHAGWDLNTCERARIVKGEYMEVTNAVVVTSDLLETRPDVVAYELLKQIFYWFGSTTHEIPYTSSENGLRYVDKDLIINSRSGW